MGAGRRSQGIEQELKAKIRFDSYQFVVHFSVPISYDAFCARTLDACQLSTGTKVTIKVIDDENDPCTVLSQNDLDEVIWSLTGAHATEIFVHVFLGEPLAAGAPCLGEDSQLWLFIFNLFFRKCLSSRG
jgi:atypical protein kinase C iota type